MRTVPRARFSRPALTSQRSLATRSRTYPAGTVSRETEEYLKNLFGSRRLVAGAAAAFVATNHLSCRS